MKGRVPQLNYWTKSKAKWKRQPVGIRSTYISGAFLVIAAIIGGLFASASSGQPNRSGGHGDSPAGSALGCRTGPQYTPLAVLVYHETVYDDPGLVAEFPTALNLDRTSLHLLDKDGLDAWLAHRPSYDGAITRIKLTLTGCEPVRILNMRAVILSRSQPLDGTIFAPASQGGALSLPLRLNLDEPDPIVTATDAKTGHPYDYFARNTFTFAVREQHTFQITGATTRFAVTWKLDVTMDVDSRLVSETIDDKGQPFRTTALPNLYHGPYEGLLHYRVAYAECYGYDGQPWPAVCSHVTPSTLWIRLKGN
jgi:hypothetical protein